MKFNNRRLISLRELHLHVCIWNKCWNKYQEKLDDIFNLVLLVTFEELDTVVFIIELFDNRTVLFNVGVMQKRSKIGRQKFNSNRGLSNVNVAKSYNCNLLKGYKLQFRTNFYPNKQYYQKIFAYWKVNLFIIRSLRIFSNHLFGTTYQNYNLLHILYNCPFS